MNTALSWILLGFFVCFLLTSGSAFTPGAGGQRVGKRGSKMELSDDQQDYIREFCNKVRPCPNDYRRESFLRAAQLARDEDF